MDDDRWQGQFVEHHGRVAPQVDPIREEDDLNRLALLMQMPGCDESVTAIVALAAEHDNPLGLAIIPEHMLSHGRSGIFHERKGWNAEALGGGVVNGAHFGRSDDFHSVSIFMKTQRSVRVGAIARVRPSR